MCPALMPEPPRRGQSCPPFGALEAHSAGEAPELAAHVSGCESCAGYVASLRGGAEAFRAARPPEQLFAQLDSRARAQPRGFKLAWLAPLPIAALVAVVALHGRTQPDDFRIKGNLAQVFVARHGGAQHIVDPKDVLHPDDALRFAVRSPADGFAAVFERDASGKVTVVAPFGAREAEPVRAGTNALADSAVLDAAGDKERFIVVLSTSPFDPASMQGELAHADAPASCKGCRVEVLEFDKRP